MASLARLSALRRVWTQAKPVQKVAVRSMSGSPFDGAPTTSLGGGFKNPSGETPPSNEVLSEWVNKEMAKGWTSKGYDYNDKKVDDEMYTYMCLVFFSAPVIYALFWAYMPDRKMRDWSLREAYLVLREREAAGVEPVSKDLVNPELLLAHLPSDEELKAAGVVINI